MFFMPIVKGDFMVSKYLGIGLYLLLLLREVAFGEFKL